MYAQPPKTSALENGKNPEATERYLKEQFGENPYELKNILKYWVRSDKEGLRSHPDRQHRSEDRQGSCPPFRHEDTGSTGRLHPRIHDTSC